MRFWIRHVEAARDTMSAEQLPDYERWLAHFDNWKTRNVEHVDRPKAKGDDVHEDFGRQTEWLREVGFERADLFVKYHLWCAIGGRRPRDKGQRRRQNHGREWG
jgi:hypothetical protein